MLKVILFLLSSLVLTEANAFLITNFKQRGVNFDLPTRVLVAGGGEKLGTQFQEVAAAKALRYRDQNADYQIIFITAEEKDLDNRSYLKRWGFNIQDEKRSNFDGESLLKELVKFKQIASVDIFSHSSAQYGIHLDSKTNRLNLNTKGLEKLKGHLMKDAYAYLHGCNAGFNLAPFLSNTWEIPVVAAMTSTNFQKLHNDGDFYLNEEGYYPNSDWALINSKSFYAPVACREGACLRLKPDNHPYVGFWGEYREGGLPFYKFFCLKNSTQDCKRVMAKSLLSFTGTNSLRTTSTLAEYKKVVLDFLCPISAKRDLRKECEENLESSLVTGDETYNPFSGRQVECNFQSCKAEIRCKKIIIAGIAKPGTCELINNFEGKATTLVREYKAYLEGFKSLNN
jgi:hypothetical protein